MKHNEIAVFFIRESTRKLILVGKVTRVSGDKRERKLENRRRMDLYSGRKHETSSIDRHQTAKHGDSLAWPGLEPKGCILVPMSNGSKLIMGSSLKSNEGNPAFSRSIR